MEHQLLQREHEILQNEHQDCKDFEALKTQLNKCEFQLDMALRQNVCLRQELDNQENEAGEEKHEDDKTINEPATVWNVLSYIPFVAPIAVAAFCIFHR